MIETLYDPIVSMPQKQAIKSPFSNLLQKINSICVFCSESTEEQNLLKNSLQKTLDLLKARRGSVFLLDHQTDELTLKASVGMKVVDKKDMVKFLGHGIVGKVALLKEPLLVENISTEERFKDYKPRSSYLSGSFICSPLLIKDHLIGVVNISDKASGKPFTQREFQLLNFLCNQVALNYQRISMLNQLGKASAETVDLKKKIESQERLVSLGKLAGGIAHEFNNPLDGVMRYNNLCMGHAQNDEVLLEYLTEVQIGLKRMANIVKNLLACARHSPGSIYKVDIHKSIEGALKEVYPYLAAKNINLVKNFAKEVPEITDWGVERIISNLVKNAIDSIDKNGTIEITTLLDENYIQILVSDDGRGITDADLGKIFEPFFTTKEIDQGCGLGLTVVNEIVKIYNGKIKVKSRPGKGTTFTVKLPVQQ
jgi:two-component system, NtrC family, sensor kinase